MLDVHANRLQIPTVGVLTLGQPHTFARVAGDTSVLDSGTETFEGELWT
jgi:hypothetical protein